MTVQPLRASYTASQCELCTASRLSWIDWQTQWRISLVAPSLLSQTSTHPAERDSIISPAAFWPSYVNPNQEKRTREQFLSTTCHYPEHTHTSHPNSHISFTILLSVIINLALHHSLMREYHNSVLFRDFSCKIFRK